MRPDIFLTIFTSPALYLRAKEVHSFSRPDAVLYCGKHVIILMFDLLVNAGRA